ncbi:MAG TPA: Gfo/Idh/MocA family oxidoreductase [Nitrososphaerales archaeon]|nr:Gfo/Idh/MocA family oxidoreductase [Nitrososphaerales archaeon]
MAEGERKVGIGMIGTGNISDLHSVGYLKNEHSKIVAVADVREAVAEEKKKAFGAERSYSDYHELLKNDSIEAVDVCVPNFLHSKIVVDAAEAGKHVLVEKPMAITVKECDEMIAAAKRNGVKLMVGHNQIFYPPHQETRRLIQEEIGRPILLLTRLHNGFRQNMGWRADPKAVGGGFFMEACVHRLYLSRYLIGEPKTVRCKMTKIYPDTVAEDIAQVTIDFENDVQGSLIANQGGPFPLWDDRTEMVGSEGLIIVNGFEEQAMAGPPLMFYKNGRWTHYVKAGHPATSGNWPLGNLEIEADFARTYAHVTSNFVDAIFEDKLPMVTGEDGKRTMEMVQACYNSSKLEKPISI